MQAARVIKVSFAVLARGQVTVMSVITSAPALTTAPIALHTFNRLAPDDATSVVGSCLALDRWVWGVVARRPYRSFDDLLEAGRDSAFPFARSEVARALDGVGAGLLWASFATVGAPAWRSGGEALGRRFQQQEAAYEARFGHRFLIRLAGRSAGEVLDQLEHRLGNDPAVEDRVVATQLRQIALLGLSHRIFPG